MLLGDEVEVEPVALWILKRQAEVQPDAVRLARYTIGQIKPFAEDPALNLDSALNHGIRSKIIAKLKTRVTDNPRDAITIAELARLYYLSGQPKNSKKAMEQAIRLAPDNRFVLRNAAQLFQNLAEPERALFYIWRSSAVREDSWIQAAEIALADTCDKSPRYGTRRLNDLLVPETGSRFTSELAAALASLELKNGSKLRRIRKLLQNSAKSATENALAQILWVEAEAGTSVRAELLTDTVTAAHEAQSRVLYDEKKFRGARDASRLWLNDQPFSIDAARDFMYISGIHLGDYSSAAKVGTEALKIHPKDHQLINAQFHALVMDNDIAAAKAMFERLEEFRGNEDVLPYVHAGRGLLAFQAGDAANGRAHYEQAVTSARAIKRPALAMNAVIYWLEQEALAGSAPAEEIANTVAAIDEVLEKAGKSRQKELGPTWDAKKPTILGQPKKEPFFVMGKVKTGDGRNVEYGLNHDKLPSNLRLGLAITD